jgi:hypothetical protein
MFAAPRRSALILSGRTEDSDRRAAGEKQIKAGIALDVFDNAHPTRIAEHVNAKDQEPQCG